MSDYTTSAKCRCCGSSRLTFLFSLGEQYVSDFPEPGRERSGPLVPIELEQCARCSLTQQRHSVKADLYGQHYWFRSSSSSTNRAALADVAAAVERRVGLKAGDVVLDIGCNDGTLLRCYSTPGIVRVGVDPAANLAEEGARGLDVFVNDFWGRGRCDTDCLEAVHDFRRARGEVPASGPTFEWLDANCSPRVITCTGMLYDLEDPPAFIRETARALAPDGVFVAQLMCAKQTVGNDDVGNYAHEHLEFYTLKCLNLLFRRHGLEIFDVEENDVNGGSYRLWARHVGSRAGGEATWALARLGEAEERAGLHEPAAWLAHFGRMQANRDRCLRYLSAQRFHGARIHARGASTKGNTILQFYGLDRSVIEAASDRDGGKWGRVTVGGGIPIVSPDESRRMRPDVYLVLPYAFRREIVGEEREFLERGGRLAFPLPEFDVVGEEVSRG